MLDLKSGSHGHVAVACFTNLKYNHYILTMENLRVGPVATVGLVRDYSCIGIQSHGNKLARAKFKPSESKGSEVMPENTIHRIRCSNCGNDRRNHAVICEHEEQWGDDEAGIFGTTGYHIAKCQGCNTVRFRIWERNSEGVDYETGEAFVREVGVFPDGTESLWQSVSHEHFPEVVCKMYLETILCFNAKAFTLAGGGLRAIVEAICKERGLDQGNLQNKIDELVTKSYLAKAQANLLHEERYLGNNALHEMRTPSKQDIMDGLEIIEGLMKTIYVLPKRAERLRIN
jgi:hypothetical protein